MMVVFTGDVRLLGGARGASEEQVKSPEELQLENTTKILSTRGCGSPAVDGYAHVVPKCLEDSPTNKCVCCTCTWEAGQHGRLLALLRV